VARVIAYQPSRTYSLHSGLQARQHKSSARIRTCARLVRRVQRMKTYRRGGAIVDTYRPKDEKCLAQSACWSTVKRLSPRRAVIPLASGESSCEARLLMLTTSLGCLDLRRSYHICCTYSTLAPSPYTSPSLLQARSPGAIAVREGARGHSNRQ